VKSKPRVKKILVVDDDVKMRGLLKEILSTFSCEVLEANDGQEALDLLAKQTVDLVITDRAMPIMDGLEFLKQLRREDTQTPVLMLSAYGDEELWASAVGLGVEDYIVKPFAADDVLKIVKVKLRD